MPSSHISEMNYLTIPKLQRLHRWRFGMDTSLNFTYYNGLNYLSLLGLLGFNLTHWPLGDLNVILKMQISILVLLIGIFKSSYDNVLRWMPQNLTDDKSTLVQVVAWCHYLNQYWPRSPTPYGITRPQWVNPYQEKRFLVGVFVTLAPWNILPTQSFYCHM